MVVVDALVVLGILSFVGWLIHVFLRNRAKRLEREFPLKVLAAAKDVAQLLLLDDSIAIKVFQELEKELRAKGKLPTQLDR